MKAARATRSGGFTLLELIVTLIMVSMMAAMVVPYFLTGITKSSEPITRMAAPLDLQNVMARIVADYYSQAMYMHDLSLLNAQIVTGNYGITASHTLTKDPNFKFIVTDLNTALKVTIRDNATQQVVTYVFTKQL